MKRFFLIALIGLFLTSCQEEVVNEYFVRVKVTNEDGVPVQNAAVKMFVPVPGSTEWYNFTDVSGELVFRSGFEAYYDIKAWKLVYEGCNYVRLVKGETVDVNVVIYPIGEPNGCVQ
jgi:hypothetical protein